MIINNRFGKNIEAEKSELEATFEMILDEIKSRKMKTINSFDTKLSDITTIFFKYYGQPSTDITKWPILKSPGKYSHASQFNKHISSTSLEGDNHLQLQKWWDAIRSAF